MQTIEGLQLKPLTEATLKNMLSVTRDPIDAMKLAADHYALNAYAAERRIATEIGVKPPKMPKPHSRCLRRLYALLKGRFYTIGLLFEPSEIERLKKLGPAVAERLERNDARLIDELVELLCMQPEQIVDWIRERLPLIEARFAS